MAETQTPYNFVAEGDLSLYVKDQNGRTLMFTFDLVKNGTIGVNIRHYDQTFCIEGDFASVVMSDNPENA